MTLLKFPFCAKLWRTHIPSSEGPRRLASDRLQFYTEIKGHIYKLGEDRLRKSRILLCLSNYAKKSNFETLRTSFS